MQVVLRTILFPGKINNLREVTVFLGMNENVAGLAGKYGIETVILFSRGDGVASEPGMALPEEV